jgi:hypothetical protein
MAANIMPVMTIESIAATMALPISYCTMDNT